MKDFGPYWQYTSRSTTRISILAIEKGEAEPRRVMEKHNLPHGFELWTDYDGECLRLEWMEPQGVELPYKLPGTSRVIRYWIRDGVNGDRARDYIRACVGSLTRVLGGSEE